MPMQWILERWQQFGRATACIEKGKSLSYADLLERIDAAKAKLPGRRAVLPIETSSIADALAQLITIADSNHIALPLPQEIPANERGNKRRIAGLDDAATPALYNQLTSSGLVLFSSGSTGCPKGMLHDLPALLAPFKRVRHRPERTLQLLLIDHIGGLDAALRSLCAGSTLIVPETRTAEAAARAIEAHRVTVLPASPTFLNLMLLDNAPRKYDCSSLRIIAYGAETMPATLLRRLGETFPNADLQQTFGTSETGAIRIASAGRDSPFFRIKDTDTEWKIVSEELWLRNPARILGYLNADNDGLEADGWYRTGDLVEEDAGGHLRIIGRAGTRINVGGQKIHPAEIEDVLREIPGVDACRVFGEPDPITGQHVACEIVSSENTNPRTWKRRIRQHGRERLVPWKLPSSVYLKDRPEVTSRMKGA